MKIEVVTCNRMDNLRAIARSICLLLMILTCGAVPSTVYHKPYNESLSLNCPTGCEANECSITINGEDAIATATVHNGQIVLRSHEWSNYGTVCCRDGDLQFCYQICPQYTEICEDCLQLSVNVTAARVGDVVMIISDMIQQPHNGISLSINGLISTNPNFTCHTTSNILSQQVIYHCTAKKTGMVTVQSNTVFCNTDLSSQRINLTVEEQRGTTDATQNGDQNTTITTNVTPSLSSDMTSIPETIITTDIVPSTSSADVIKAIATTTLSNDNMVSITSTATSEPTDNDRSNATTGIVIAIVAVFILGLLLTAVVLFVLVRLCGYQLPFLASGGTGTDNTTEFEDGQNIHLANGNMDQQQHRDLSPSCQHPVQQQPTDTANVEIFQLPGQRLHYMPSDA